MSELVIPYAGPLLVVAVEVEAAPRVIVTPGRAEARRLLIDAHSDPVKMSIIEAAFAVDRDAARAWSHALAEQPGGIVDAAERLLRIAIAQGASGC